MGDGSMDKAARRQQILNEARDVFAKRGYHAAKVDDIIKAAGIARGTFYLYFEDKRAIFDEIVDRMLTRVGMSITRVDVEQPIAAQIRENITSIVRVLLEDRSTTRILLSDARGVDPAFDRKLQSFMEEVHGLMENALRDGQELGIVRKGDARIQGVFAMGALRELLFQVVVRGWDYPEKKIVDELYALLEHGLLRV
jgi:AcrR family transcriptional regulator